MVEKAQQNNQEEVGECGWGSCNPVCCQRFKRPGCLLFWLCAASFLQGMVLNGLVSVVISSLEKRYGLKSSESGLIGSCYDIMTTICFLPVSYFGGLGFKQRYLSVGIFLIGIASFVFAVPQFSTGLYEFGADDDKLCVMNRSSSASCDEPSEYLANFRYVFYLAMLLAGAGSVSFFSLAQPYLDENVPLSSSALYLGVYHMCNAVGPAAGYLIGALSLRYYVDFYRTDITVELENTRYVGAWWMGFLLSAVLCVFVAVPLFGFPPVLRKIDKKEREKEEYSRKGNGVQLEFNSPQSRVSDSRTRPVDVSDNRTRPADLPRRIIESLKVLLVNPTFVFLTIAETCEGFLLSGSVTFLPKYTEIQFNLPASSAALYTGLAVVPAGGLGMFLGGYLVKRFNLTVPGVLRLCLGIKCGATVIGLFILINCSKPPFAGVNIEYGTSLEASQNFLGEFQSNPCHENCTCQKENGYKPVCGGDRVTYYSPCHAGCVHTDKGESTTKFYNCSCVTVEGKETYDAELGACSENCVLLPVFMVLCSIYVMVNFMITIPALLAVLRCVPFKERAFALGIQQTFSRVFGFIPGPIAYGVMLDQACLLWQTKCDTEGFCFFYDVNIISILATVLYAGFNVLTCLFLFIAWKLYKSKSEKQITLSNESFEVSGMKDNRTLEKEEEKQETVSSVKQYKKKELDKGRQLDPKTNGVEGYENSGQDIVGEDYAEHVTTSM